MLGDFIQSHTGVMTGNTTENMGECVGLVSVWMDTFGIPHLYGNAKDLLANALAPQFAPYVGIIYNTPTGFPLPGDIVCWDKSWGGGYGHTAIVITADVNKMTVFEQNNPVNSLPKTASGRNYNGVQGWMHIKVAPMPTGDMYKGYDLANRESMKSAVDVLVRVLSGEFVDKPEYDKLQETIKNLNNSISDKNRKIDDLTGQVSSLQGEVSQLTHENIDLTTLANMVPDLKKNLIQAQDDRTLCLTSQESMNKQIGQLRNTSYKTAPTADLLKEVVQRLLKVKS